MKRLHVVLLATALSIAGLALFAYKVAALGFPLLPDARIETWRVEIQLRFVADGRPVKARLMLPVLDPGFTVVDQSFASPGYGVTLSADSSRPAAVYSIREARGEQVLYYRAVIHRNLAPSEASAPSVPATGDAPVAAVPQLGGAELAAAKSIVEAAQRQASDAETLAGLIIKRLKEARPGDEADFLLGYQPSTARIAQVGLMLLRLAGVPARLVRGLPLLPERRDAHFVRWIEVYGEGEWHTVHLLETKPPAARDVLTWWRGAGPIVAVTGAQDVAHSVAVSRSYEFALEGVVREGRRLERKLVEFSLFGLPLQTQSVFHSLMVIPIGILLLVILRNVVGVKTFGTFMPVLIALSFRQTQLAWGLVFFGIVLAAGLTVRFYFERLRLLLVPRLAAVVIVVILIMAALSLVSHRLAFDRGLSIGLFPIVILTMTIERMTITWEELGAGEALQQAAGSLAVAALCYGVMNLPIVDHLAFVFPELLLIVLAILLLLGRYSGYRLVELWRFRKALKG